MMLAAGLLMLLLVTDADAAGRVFYDGSEAGNTNLWLQDDTHPLCTSVTASVDGVQGPYAGSRMIRCNDAPGLSGGYESLKTPTFTMGNEIFYRARVRRDANHQQTGGSPKKFLRIFSWHGNFAEYVDVFEIIGTENGFRNDLLVDGVRANDSLYWGDGSGDTTNSSANWHLVEYYCNRSTGACKVWHDDVLRHSYTFASPIVGGLGESQEFFITSNWSDSYTGNNYLYFDDIEIYTDTGTGGTGLMSDGTITQDGGGGGGSVSGSNPTGGKGMSPRINLRRGN